MRSPRAAGAHASGEPAAPRTVVSARPAPDRTTVSASRPRRTALVTLVAASRPFSWVNTALPFLAGALLVDRHLTAVAVAGTLYFTLPYNLLLYGVNDLFDHASDVRNPRKGSLEGALVPPSMAQSLWALVVLTNLPLLALLVALGGLRVAPVLALTVGIALAYSAPPLRTKVRPGLDSLTSALHFALPVAVGMITAGRDPAELPWSGFAAFVAWGIASHALGAVQDIAYDRAAGIGSVATVLGARRTAAISLVGYLAAVVVAASTGPVGALAALIVLPYALLPLPLLARPDEVRAHRAWRSFLSLNLLAGFLLTQLLLRYWTVTTWTPFDLLAWLAALGAGVVALDVALNAALLRRPADRHGPLPSLTVVVAAHGEATGLRATLDALAAQDYPGLQIVVAEDDATAATASVAASVPGPHAVLRCPSKPGGWSGRSWAAWCGARAATTELVLFVDADTVLAPGAAAALAGELAARDLDLVSGVPRYRLGGHTARVLTPGFPMFLFGFLPLWLVSGTLGRPAALAFAHGPLMLVRREAYLAVGGHSVNPSSEREGPDLARAVARAGRRVGLVEGTSLGSTHHETGPEVAEAWRRTLDASVGHSLPALLLTLALETAAWLLPVALLPVAAAAALGAVRLPDAWPGIPPALAASLPFALLLVAQLTLVARRQLPASAIAWSPLTALATLVLQARGAWSDMPDRPITWPGRGMAPAVAALAAPTATAVATPVVSAPWDGREDTR